MESHHDRLGSAVESVDVNIVCVNVAFSADELGRFPRRHGCIWPCFDISAYFQPDQARKSVSMVSGIVT
jgi:hypothetical protein